MSKTISTQTRDQAVNLLNDVRFKLHESLVAETELRNHFILFPPEDNGEIELPTEVVNQGVILVANLKSAIDQADEAQEALTAAMQGW